MGVYMDSNVCLCCVNVTLCVWECAVCNVICVTYVYTHVVWFVYMG